MLAINMAKGYPVYKGDPQPTPEQADYMDGVGLELLDQEPLKDRYAEGIRRDNICKRLSLNDRIALMARYGRDLHGQPLKGQT